MSLLWRDQLRVILCPDRMVMVRLSGGLRPRVLSKDLVTYSPVADRPWKPALEAMRTGLSGSVATANTTVVLSNQFVRYRLIPWSNQLSDTEEEGAWVATRFGAAGGDAQAPAEYRWDASNADTSCLATAIDRELIAGIEALFGSGPVRLQSIQPYFMFAFNRWRGECSHKRLWFVLCEPGHVAMALIARNRWQGFRACRIDGDWRTEIPIVLRREMLLLDNGESAEILIHYAGLPDNELRRLDLPSVRALSPPPVAGYSPMADTSYAMAFSGA